jgi:hypothetical protein
VRRRAAAVVPPFLTFISLSFPIADVPKVALSLEHQMDRLQRQQSKCCCRYLVDSLLLSKILQRFCTGRTVVVRSIVFSPLFLIISLRQTSQNELYFGTYQSIHRADHEVSSILVVSSIPCYFPKSSDGLVPVTRSIVFSHLFLVIPLRHTSETQRFSTVDGAGTRNGLPVCVIAVVVRLCFACTFHSAFYVTISLTVVSTFSRLVDRLVAMNAFPEAEAAGTNTVGLPPR